MLKELWCPENNRILLCIDAYRDGILSGRFYDVYLEKKEFNSLTQLLIKMEALLEERGTPQSSNRLRTFAVIPDQMEAETYTIGPCIGEIATFELKIMFRQHASWQGTILWKEQRQEQSFRSVLELIHLLDSALRALEDGAA